MITNAGVKRGQESWNYIYRFLGFVLAIEGTAIGMLPLPFPWNIIAYAIVGYGTWFLFLDYGPFQNWLLSKKTKYEDKAR